MYHEEVIKYILFRLFLSQCKRQGDLNRRYRYEQYLIILAWCCWLMGTYLYTSIGGKRRMSTSYMNDSGVISPLWSPYVMTSDWIFCLVHLNFKNLLLGSNLLMDHNNQNNVVWHVHKLLNIKKNSHVSHLCGYAFSICTNKFPNAYEEAFSTTKTTSGPC